MVLLENFHKITEEGGLKIVRIDVCRNALVLSETPLVGGGKPTRREWGPDDCQAGFTRKASTLIKELVEDGWKQGLPPNELIEDVETALKQQAMNSVQLGQEPEQTWF